MSFSKGKRPDFVKSSEGPAPGDYDIKIDATKFRDSVAYFGGGQRFLMSVDEAGECAENINPNVDPTRRSTISCSNIEALKRSNGPKTPRGNTPRGNNDSQGTLLALRDETAAIKKKLKEECNKSSQTVKEMELKDKEIKQLKERLAKVESRMKQTLQEKNEIVAQRASDLKQLKLGEKQQDQAESAINDVKSIREKLSSVTAELEELTKVHAKEVAQAATTTQELEELVAKYAQLEEEADSADLMHRLDMVAKVKREATSNATAAAEFATELGRMESECKASVKETDAKHQTELEALQQQQEEAVAELKAAKEEMFSTHQAEIQEFQEVIEETDKEMKAAAEEIVAKHQAELVSLQQQREEAETEHKNEVSELNAQAAEYTDALAMHTEVQAMTAEINETEKAELSGELTKTQAEVETQKELNEELNTKSLQLQNELDGAQFEVTSLAREKQEVEEEVKAMNQQVQAAEDGMISCASDKQELEHTMQTLRDQIKQADEREAAQKESMAAEEQTVVEMSKQIATMNQQNGTLNETIQKADSAKADHLKAVADLEQENEKQYETFDQEKTELKAQMKQAQQKHEEEAQKLKEELAESKEQIVNNKDVFEERENAISELQGAIEKMSQNLVHNEHQLKELQTTEKAQQQREQELVEELEQKEEEVAALRVEKDGEISELTEHKQAADEKTQELSKQLQIQQANVLRLTAKLKEFDSSMADTLLQYDNMDCLLNQHREMRVMGTQTSTDMTSDCGTGTGDKAALMELHGLRQSMIDSLDERQKLFDDCSELRDAQMTTQKLSDANADQVHVLEQQADALQKENNDLSETNAKLVGHSNHKQKIQHHVAVKKENAELKTATQKLKSAVSTADRKVKRYEEELAKMKQANGSAEGPSIDFDKEEALMDSLQEERRENERMSAMLRQVATEVLEVAGSEETLTMSMSENRRLSDCQKLAEPPQVVLDLCVGKLRDISMTVDQKERTVKEQGTQIKILQDKNKLLEQRITVLSA